MKRIFVIGPSGKARNAMRHVKELIKDESAATAVEYGLIAALLVVGLIVALDSVAGQTIRMWTNVTDKSAEAMRK